MTGTNPMLAEDSWGRPAVARIDNWMLGETENFEFDRELARKLLYSAPWLKDMVEINGQYRPRVVLVLARDFGITQFADLGCGLPPRWSRARKRYEPGAPVYDAASAVHDEPRVVYVDNDPTVCGHARTVLDEYPTTAAVECDIRDVDRLLDHLGNAGLDRGAPIAVLLHDLLPWLNDAEAHLVMATLREWLPAGSAISVTHATADWAPETMQELVGHYAAADISYRPRSLGEITDLLGPWDLLPPGIVLTGQWRPTEEAGLPPGEHSHAYAAVITNGAAPVRDPCSPSPRALPTESTTPSGAYPVTAP
ncbi:SAM-dependent methyltransferase [Streptomyces rubradiris]|uniref:S-adenosyl methyltransferase n=1 Tax=Streptomyces rubradiris TaxID=285531 RepID=A0ABQ3RDI7_STRRR|nr:SAM-dependent methyltransferase [Streptomyces rubradiris]GHG95404.1 hypothetical protein GCM10018792_06170 [Streptomyces rubradiris]GHI53880.1 hypothetical protein Srubr_37260 [Streptomyces rubradiris]